MTGTGASFKSLVDEAMLALLDERIGKPAGLTGTTVAAASYRC